MSADGFSGQVDQYLRDPMNFPPEYLWWLRRLIEDLIPGDVDTAGGSGIQFDTEPQSGGWLYWETTGAGSPPNAYGLDIKDGSTYGINIEATGNGAVNLGADGAGDTNLYATDGSVNISTSTGLVGLTVGPGGNGIVIDNNSGSDTVITADGAGSFLVLRATDTIQLIISSGGAGYLLLTNLPTVNPGGSHRVWNNGGVLNIT